MGATTIAWNTRTVVGGQVFRCENGGPEQLFATGRKGKRAANGIAAGTRYEFRLYEGMNRARRLASVTVTRESTSWDTVASGLRAYAAQEHYWGEIADLLGDVIPRFFRYPHRPKYFHCWEPRGFHVTPVHYYYPIPDTRQLPDHLWNQESTMPGIDMNDATQLDLLRRSFPQFREEYEQFPRDPTTRADQFYFSNTWFGGTDALVLYCMIRQFRPRLVLEIGSGFSTRVSLQAAYKNGDTRLICIEPYPNDRGRHDVLHADTHGVISLITEKVEDVELALFERLSSGDILFIDSSHVSRTGGDVNRLILDVLPRLKPGVIVHFHDIFLPWEYPREWVVEKMRFFSEQYLLQAFLSFNPHYSVLMANHYLGRKHQAELRATFPSSPWWGGESFWIRRRL